MKPVKLSENIVSLLGRNLQALLKNQFSESYLNKILRLIPNHPETDDHMRKILPPDAVIGTFQVSLYSPSGINDFLDFKNAAGIQLKGKPHLIMLEIMPVVATTYNSEISINPEMLFNLLKTIVACIKNGAHMLKFGNPDLRTDDLSPGTSSEKLLCNLISAVIHEISPSTLIITETKQFQNDRFLVAEWNQFLQRNN